MKPYYFIIAGLIIMIVSALLGTYVPGENPTALGVIGFAGIITALGGAIATGIWYDDNH
jgi:xanthosine utilization system XapX-like protein